MAARRGGSVVYWDSSAVLSSLFADAHSEQAIGWSRRDAVHLLSSLAHAETVAVIARLEREQHLPKALSESARDALARGPWRRLMVLPEWDLVDEMATKWPLRGADLWHLATALTLQRELPSLGLLTFDTRLAAAASGTGLDVPGS
jgi:predicted nucleic acid-binding protein